MMALAKCDVVFENLQGNLGMISFKVRNWHHDDCFSLQVCFGIKANEATFQKHNIVFAGTMPKKPNSNMKKENGNMRCHSQAIVFLKATCPTLKCKNNNSDPYRIILKDVAKFANGHNCSKSRHLHEFKNWTDCKVPDLCNVANNPKR